MEGVALATGLSPGGREPGRMGVSPVPSRWTRPRAAWCSENFSTGFSTVIDTHRLHFLVSK